MYGAILGDMIGAPYEFDRGKKTKEFFDYVQEMRMDRNEDPRGFSGMNPWSNRMVCGKCGNYFRHKHRHYRVCWECRDSYRKEDPCKNTFVYETAREWHVKEVMRRLLTERADVVSTLAGIIDGVIKDVDRRDKVKSAVKSIPIKPAAQLVSDDGDLLIAITAIRFFPDDHIEAEMVDGSRVEMELKPCWPDERKRRKHRKK